MLGLFQPPCGQAHLCLQEAQAPQTELGPPTTWEGSVTAEVGEGATSTVTRRGGPDANRQGLQTPACARGSVPV